MATSLKISEKEGQIDHLHAIPTICAKIVKNLIGSRKFTQIPSVWWKNRENRSSRYWDSFAHSKKI